MNRRMFFGKLGGGAAVVAAVAMTSAADTKVPDGEHDNEGRIWLYGVATETVRVGQLVRIQVGGPAVVEVAR